MPIPSPETRAKIAESLRRYYANPTAKAKLVETGRKGGRATIAKRAAAEAEVARLQAELDRLSGGDPR